MRPMNDRERGNVKAFQCQADRNAVSDLQSGETYTYDKTFDESSNTSDVYTHIAKDIVTGVMNGINGTVFACKQRTLPILISSCCKLIMLWLIYCTNSVF